MRWDVCFCSDFQVKQHKDDVNSRDLVFENEGKLKWCGNKIPGNVSAPEFMASL